MHHAQFSRPRARPGRADDAAAAAQDPARAIAFQGAPGANSHRAAIEYAPGCLPLPCFSFEDALDAVKAGQAGAAIIPIENSQHGRVADIHFLLPESGLSIVGEYFLPITYAVMATRATAPSPRPTATRRRSARRGTICASTESCRWPMPTPQAPRPM